ncbi:hypothetical protein GCM10027038_09620 [Arthrobacter bambusae]
MAVHIRKPDVESYYGGVVIPHDFDAFASGGGRVHHESSFFEDGVNQIPHIFVILNDNSYPRLAHWTSSWAQTAAQPSAMREVSPKYSRYKH